MTNIIPPPKLESYGDKLGKGNYTIHSRFSRAVNFFSSDATSTSRLISVVNTEIDAGPVNIVISGLNTGQINSLFVDDNFIQLNGVKLALNESNRFESKLDFGHVNIGRFDRNLNFFRTYLVQHSHPKSLVFLLDGKRKENFNKSFGREYVKKFQLATNKIFCSEPVEGIKMIRGMGFGLTPSGDDFLSGILIALNIIQALYRADLTASINEIYKTAQGNNPLSNTFLKCARDGLLFERFKKLVYSLLYLSKEDVFDHVQDLLSVGSTSGADQGVGFLMAFKRRLLWL